MSGSQVIITSPGPDDGDGIVAPPTPRIQVQIIYTPDDSESPGEILHETNRLQREADRIVARD